MLIRTEGYMQKYSQGQRIEGEPMKVEYNPSTRLRQLFQYYPLCDIIERKGDYTKWGFKHLHLMITSLQGKAKL